MTPGSSGESETHFLDKSSDFARRASDRDLEQLLRRSVARYPDNAELSIRLATVLFEGSPRESVVLAHRAVDLSKGDPWMLTRAASLLFYHREFESSFDYTERGMEIAKSLSEEPEYALDLLHLAGRHASLRGQDDVAEEALQIAFDEDPAAEHGRVLADFYASRDRPSEALAVIDQALQMHGNDPALIRTRERIKAHFGTFNS